MTNKEWLDYLAQNAPDELAAWFDAEHVETEERALDGDTDALNAKIAELTAERDNWKEHSRTIEYRCKKAETDCEIYRKKFGKCLDYSDAIHALMDDEGMA